ncbi:sigma-54-dependent transcriptional regulator [Carboxylicivirga linearis]|uniref:Sigma-54-dependent Fis family transcriptional regulator n=1 Tax=Carboxylicivirga linearis TaxID=1628157 RepID=A0ABS5JVV8_9BACT|nr:sigma-54 dependent transcriptional regulator [Carboxylicivirga linearis]MBS2098993.1 sigma-54-dependent Fis family transcriptional regulator [Carboxylicivirga linearis]
MNQILVIDDDTFMCNLLETYLSNNGYKVDAVYSAEGAKTLLRQKKYDIAVCDFRLPDSDGLEMLKAIKSKNTETKVIIITAYADVRMAVKLMKAGAFDYVTKPLQQEELLQLVKQVSKKEPNGRSNSEEKEFIIGTSPKIKEVISLCNVVAPTKMSVLIQGETGAGKEYIARFIHQNSDRKDKPFVAVDCGAIPKDLANSELFGHLKGAFTGAINNKIGVFEQANGGTLFLDEVGNLAYDLQVKLLRAIQERVITKLGSTKSVNVDVRIIAATNDELEVDIQNNNFREDLYHRLNEFKLTLPALRERKEDIMVFANHFIQEANKDLNKAVEELDPEVIITMQNYPWHGNLRELRNVVKRSVLLSTSASISLESLPDEIKNHKKLEAGDMVNQLLGEVADEDENAPDLKNAAHKFEKEVIITTLEEVNFNKSEAARKLNIDRKTLYNKMKMLEIDYKALKRM